ncbi:hypothetical protein [Amycolatopsis thermophila]|uniref:DUF1918 domain-containing protein n=1 Tax=Amycolatopsis thermophila TaxID=206084 RepID=A0ABU0ETK2_9PSEU|nr:hypothetical protein [Amycolatopsis thermophila]MDQ0378598.1 hypothetical protein [Amycolatopsis thermophila]
MSSKPAETLRVGDWVVLHDGRPAPVRKLTHTASGVTILTDHLRVTWRDRMEVPVVVGGGR